jgi:hypothetical protein
MKRDLNEVRKNLMQAIEVDPGLRAEIAGTPEFSGLL